MSYCLWVLPLEMVRAQTEASLSSNSRAQVTRSPTLYLMLMQTHSSVTLHNSAVCRSAALLFVMEWDVHLWINNNIALSSAGSELFSSNLQPWQNNSCALPALSGETTSAQIKLHRLNCDRQKQGFRRHKTPLNANRESTGWDLTLEKLIIACVSITKSGSIPTLMVQHLQAEYNLKASIMTFPVNFNLV